MPADAEPVYAASHSNYSAASHLAIEPESLLRVKPGNPLPFRNVRFSALCGQPTYFRLVPIALKKSASRRSETATKLALLKLGLR
jgi:hypothetical protein